MKKIVRELSILVESSLTEEDVSKIKDLNKVISDFVSLNNDIKKYEKFKTKKKINELIDFIKISNEIPKIEIY